MKINEYVALLISQEMTRVMSGVRIPLVVVIQLVFITLQQEIILAQLLLLGEGVQLNGFIL